MKMFVDVGAVYLHRDAVDFRKWGSRDFPL